MFHAFETSEAHYGAFEIAKARNLQAQKWDCVAASLLFKHFFFVESP